MITLSSAKGKGIQGGHGTGKTGNLALTFSRQGKHRKFCCNKRKSLRHRENILTVIINISNVLLYSNFKDFSLALLDIILNFKVSSKFTPTCHMYHFYLCIYSLSLYIDASYLIGT